MKQMLKLLQQFGLRQINLHSDRTQYEGFFTTGGFGEALFDYDRGILYMKIISYPVAGSGKYIPFISISNIDDGVWQATSFIMNEMPLKDSNRIVDLIFVQWPIKWASKLPSEDELNKFLSNFGMFGKFTG